MHADMKTCLESLQGKDERSTVVTLNFEHASSMTITRKVSRGSLQRLRLKWMCSSSSTELLWLDDEVKGLRYMQCSVFLIGLLGY